MTAFLESRGPHSESLVGESCTAEFALKCREGQRPESGDAE